MITLNRRTITVTASIIAILIIIWLGSSVLGGGRINVSTNDSSNTVLIARTGNIGNSAMAAKAYSNTSNGSTSVKVLAGIYTINVSNGSFASSQVVTVKSGQTVKVTLNPNKLGTTEPVSDRSVTGLIATSSGMAFIDTNNHNLYRVDALNHEHLLDSAHAFVTVRWADLSYGVGQDINHNLFTITNNGITPIALPFPITAGNNLYFALTSSHKLYVSYGTTLYVGTAEAGLKKLYDATVPITIYSASDWGILLSESDNGNKTTNFVVVNATTGATVKSAGDAYDSAWSPDGSHLVISSDETTAVLDRNLKKVINLPTNNVNSPVWLDNNTLLYGILDQLWEFNIQTGKATALASVADIGYVGHITPSLSGDYIYFLIQNTTTNTFQLGRIGLHGQPVTPTILGLSVLLPNTIGQCKLDYLNFTAPTIIVRSPAAQAAACTQTATGYLSTYSHTLDMSQLKFDSTTLN